ncbi:hypothetical protein [Microvirga sp. TS319]|uniref:hypothetical protein n=1 Tax=Microvirga sp. TS319 TaxID=3241165 RepID=UPI00351A6070
MRMLTHIVGAAAMMLIGQGPTLAGCHPSDPAIPVGIITGDADKDTFGLACISAEMDRTGSTTMMSPRHVMQVGPGTGDAEKDSLGYVQVTGAQ